MNNKIEKQPLFVSRLRKLELELSPLSKLN